MASATRTIDHDDIHKWTEARCGRPARVDAARRKRTADGGQSRFSKLVGRDGGGDG